MPSVRQDEIRNEARSTAIAKGVPILKCKAGIPESVVSSTMNTFNTQRLLDKRGKHHKHADAEAAQITLFPI